MKGSRAKKAAEAAAAVEAAPQLQEAQAEAAAARTPAAPKEPRPGPPRPGPIVLPTASFVQIPEDVFKRICAGLRTNELLGPAAADALEEAAGLRGPSSPACKAAKELRSSVAEHRGEPAEEVKKEAKPKKKMGGFADQVDEIPHLEEKPAPRGRVSISEAHSDEAADGKGARETPEKDAPEPPDLNLTPKQNHMRTDLEMWVMDEIPTLFGMDDSDELDEDLQEDGQSLKISQLIAEESPEEQRALLGAWLREAPDEGAKQEFMGQIIEKVEKIQVLGPKKKKKKKKAEA